MHRIYNNTINSTYSNAYNKNATNKHYGTKCQTNFKGHVLRTTIGDKTFLHQTGFFRDFETLKQIIRYLKNIENPKILFGACSTGEETMTLKMLLSKAQITGFDISKEAINRAKSGLYYMQLDNRNDSFLHFHPYTMQKQNADARFCYELFHQNFKLYSGGETMSDHVIYEYLYPNDIKYKVGDALDIENIAQGEKYDAFMFSNAIYQLIGRLDENLNYFPKDKETQIKILQKLIKGINKILNKDGYFVFSETELNIRQDISIDTNMLTTILNENGFQKMYSPEGNIWKKVRDV